MKGEKNKKDYLLFISKHCCWAVECSVGRIRRWMGEQEGGRQAGREEKYMAHIFLPHGSMLCEKGGNTFAQVVITAHWPFCNFPCRSCAEAVSKNIKWGCVKCPDFSNAYLCGFINMHKHWLGWDLARWFPCCLKFARGRRSLTSNKAPSPPWTYCPTSPSLPAPLTLATWQ